MKHAQPPTADQVEALRKFNRFYTRQIGLLEDRLLRSPFTLTEARVLFELAHREKPTASELAALLVLDPGYLSRILKKFESEGLLRRVASPDDARRSFLALTETGRQAFQPLDKASREQVRAMLDPLPSYEREKLASAMETVERLLAPVKESKVSYILRPLRVGDIGWIVHRQSLLYHQEYGWDESYEALAAEILSGFLQNFDPRQEASFIAERDSEIVGSVFLMRQSQEIAKLRLLYVEPSARGLGIGGRLVEECVAFARAKGYRRLSLWTNDVLASARRIYQAAGFRLEKEEQHHSFGKDLTGQTWVLDL